MDQKELIDLLVYNPKNDREIGFNDAIIMILKSTQQDPFTTKLQHIVNFLRTIIVHDCNQTTILELADYVLKNQKLSFVKLYKDATGTGLKEAKDFADPIFEKFQ